MNNYQEILKAAGIEDALEEMILEKHEYLRKEGRRLKRLYGNIDWKKLDEAEQFFLQEAIYQVYGLREYLYDKRALNNLCFALIEATRVEEENSKVTKGQWSRKWEQLQIVDAVSRYVEVKNPKYNIKCPLPGHEDRSPSFHIYEETNSFYCFGCNRGGQPINFIMLMENCDFKTAIQRI